MKLAALEDSLQQEAGASNGVKHDADDVTQQQQRGLKAEINSLQVRQMNYMYIETIMPLVTVNLERTCCLTSV